MGLFANINPQRTISGNIRLTPAEVQALEAMHKESIAQERERYNKLKENTKRGVLAFLFDVIAPDEVIDRAMAYDQKRKK